MFVRGAKKRYDYWQMQLFESGCKTVGRTEFWKQIKRTVNGQEVSEQDIQMIVTQVKSHLDLCNDDHLLDLGCGNGALSSYFFGDIREFTGVDFSEYLLGVADEFFHPDKATYINDDVVAFVRSCGTRATFTKVLIYGVMSYLDRESLSEVLTRIGESFRAVSRIFIGNIPNEHMMKRFYSNRGNTDYDSDDPSSPIGVWWKPPELSRICEEAGYEATELRMPEEFYGAGYRFDMLLVKR